MSEHLDLDRLADLLAGEGPADDVAHVERCSGCAGRLDELAVAEVEVAAALAALPAPELPDGLADRLSAALAAEPPLTPSAAAAGWADGGSDAERTGSSRTVTPFPAAREPRRRTWLPVAAAAALLVSAGAVGGGVLLSQRGGGSADDSISAAGGGAGQQEDLFAGVPRSSTGQDYAAEGALAASLPGLLAGDAPAGAAAPAPAQDGADAEAPEVAASSETRALTSAEDAQLDRLRDPEALTSCLAAVLPPDEDVLPLALDYAAFQGEPVLVVLLPATDAPDKVDVFVVGAGCTLGDDQTRYFARLDRPA